MQSVNDHLSQDADSLSNKYHDYDASGLNCASGILSGVGFELATDVSRQPICPAIKGQAVWGLFDPWS